MAACVRCGASLTDSSRYCGECGAPVGTSLRPVANEFVCGQTYFGDAHVLIVLAARFERAF